MLCRWTGLERRWVCEYDLAESFSLMRDQASAYDHEL